jgi:ribosomal protein S18 acetylase RimI-like enzyme
MKIVFEPSPKYIEQISNWLDAERVGNVGFYYNFINSDFSNDNFVCLVNDNDDAIGYIDYWSSDLTAKLNVAVVKKSEQKKGFGKLLLNELIKKLKSIGIVAISLDCVPATSKKVWKKLGFKEFKEIENHTYLNFSNYNRPWLFMFLVDVEKPTKKQNLDSYIEIWTVEEYKAGNSKPSYRWDVNTQTKPIIYPVDGNWKIKYVNNGEVINDYKIKYYNKGNNLEDYFLIIPK